MYFFYFNTFCYISYMAIYADLIPGYRGTRLRVLRLEADILPAEHHPIFNVSMTVELDRIRSEWFFFPASQI